MRVNPIDKLFDIQLQLFRKQISPEVFVETIEECVEEGLPLNLTIFTKLLECWHGLENSHFERLFTVLRKASNMMIAENPEAAFTFFKAAQKCAKHIELCRLQKKAA